MKEGSTLLELLVYFACFSLILFISFQFTTVLHSRFLANYTWMRQQMNFSAATNVIQRALQEAPREEIYWKKIDPQEIVYRDHDHDIGFAFDKKRLVKRVGSYQQNIGWHKKQVTVLADGIQTGSFYCNQLRGNVNGVEWEAEMIHNQKPLIFKQYVCLRNRNWYR